MYKYKILCQVGYICDEIYRCKGCRYEINRVKDSFYCKNTKDFERDGYRIMEKGNVLVIGNSGVGKSTLINAVLGEVKAKTGAGTEGTTKGLELYEGAELPFRVIDTIGFEPTFIKEQLAIHAVKKWSKDCAKKGKEDNQINVIWFCVDGTSKKLFPKAIQSLSRATSIWKSVPVIVVITKSYSVLEREENIEMVQNAFASQKKYSKNLKKIIPVVADTYRLNETAFAPPEGISELIDLTNEFMPEGLQAGFNDLARFKLERKRALAQSVVGASTVSAAIVGASPTNIADSLVLMPLEMAEINGIGMIYGLNNKEQLQKFKDSFVEVGAVTTTAKALISNLKNIPGIQIAGSVLNAIVAGSMVAALGEATIYAMEQVYLGKKTFDDIDWLKKLLESKLSQDLINRVVEIAKIVSKKGGKLEIKDIAQIITELFVSKK